MDKACIFYTEKEGRYKAYPGVLGDAVFIQAIHDIQTIQ
jgi:hypothetical protein